MPIVFYDLCGGERERRFSPYCWRVKMALAHKGLEVDNVPVFFTEIPLILDGEHKRVPVIVDGRHTIEDSWNIALYLEEVYGDKPSLFGGEGGRAATNLLRVMPMIF